MILFRQLFLHKYKVCFNEFKIKFFRFDIGRPTRRFVLQSFTLQTGTVSIVIYFVALILSLCMANLEDKMNLYNRYPDLWMDVNVSICRNFIVCLIPQSFYIAKKF